MKSLGSADNNRNRRRKPADSASSAGFIVSGPKRTPTAMLLALFIAGLAARQKNSSSRPEE